MKAIAFIQSLPVWKIEEGFVVALRAPAVPLPDKNILHAKVRFVNP